MAVDTSKFTIDTPVCIKVKTPGYWFPEFSTYSPLELYAPIEKVIAILNRGISVEFPQQSSKNEISNKIEEFIIEYELKRQKAEKKGYVDANRVDTAIELIQEINDSKITPKEELEEREKHLFDYSDITDRIVNNLSNQMFDRVFDSDDFISAEERIKKADTARKHKEILDARKAESRRLLSYEAEAINKLIKDAKWEDEVVMEVNDLPIVDPITASDMPKYNKRK